MTVLDLVSRSLKLIGVLADGETPSSSQVQDAMDTLNELLESWANERLMIRAVDRSEYLLAVSKQIYTLGIDPAGTTTADFTAPRPQQIQRAAILTQLDTPTPIELPMELLTVDDWADITLKGVPSTIPTRLYVKFSYPFIELALWPYPIAIVKLVLYSWPGSQVAQFANPTDDVFMPPGYTRMLRYNLAVELCPDYGIDVPMVVAAKAADSKDQIKGINFPLSDLKCDPALLLTSQTGRVWDWRTGDYK